MKSKREITSLSDECKVIVNHILTFRSILVPGIPHLFLGLHPRTGDLDLSLVMVTGEIKLFQLSSMCVRNNFISEHENLPEIISKLFQRHYCSS